MKKTHYLFTLICIIFATLANLYAQDHENVEQVGRIYNHWGTIRDVDMRGDYAYLASSSAGFQILDISDPEDIAVVGSYDDLPDDVSEIAVSGDFAYLLSYEEGLWIVEFTDPVNPTIVANLNIPGVATDLHVNGDQAFVSWREYYGIPVADSARGGFVLFDISDPSEPEEVVTFDEVGAASCVSAQGNHAYLAINHDPRRQGRYFALIDISNPEEPYLVGDVSTREDPNHITIEGDFAYLTSYSSSRLYSVDISDPTHPEIAGSIHDREPGNSTHTYDVKVRGDYAYVAAGRSGVKIIDISDPYEMAEVGYYDLWEVEREWNVGTGVIDIDIEGDLVVATFPRAGVLSLLDVSEPQDPTETGFFQSSNKSSGVLNHVASEGNYVYTNLPEFTIIDISEMDNPREVFRSDTLEYRDVVVSGDYAYLTRTGTDPIPTLILEVMNISDPTQPQLIGSVIQRERHFPQYLTLGGDYIFVSARFNPMQIFDVSDPTRPEYVAEFELGNDLESKIVFHENFLYIARRGLQILDVSDPSEPEEIAHVELDYNIADVGIFEDRAYTVGDEGMYVFDVESPDNPQQIAFYPEYRGVEINILHGIAFVASQSRGLRMLDISNPDQVSEIGYYVTPGSALDVAINGNFAIVADFTNIGIYDFSEAADLSVPVGVQPTIFSFDPAYPNPFNSTTTISFTLPTASHLSLDVLNLAGQTVSTMFEGYMQAGMHQASLNAHSLPSGLYFVRLQAADQVFTQKVMLIR